MSAFVFNDQAMQVLQAVKHCAKPWSVNGGGKLSEIALKSNVQPSVASLILHKLVQEKFLIELKSTGRYEISRYYLNIYNSNPKKK